MTDEHASNSAGPHDGTPAGTATGDTIRQTTEQLNRSRELSTHGSEPPAEVPGYLFIRRLGEGAYGSVWLASEQNTGKRVAIKFYTHRGGLDWSLLSREVEKLAVLYTSHNIVGLLDVGWDADPPHYVMEYLENGSLANYLSSGPVTPVEAVRIARSVLRGLVHAHGCGILHCDLKPANVLLDADFEPRLCDFGQSRLSHEQDPALGTLFYMAPEQADLKSIPDARWDVYALGALLFEMLVGRPPHQSASAEAQIQSGETLEDRLATYRRILHTSPLPDEHRRIRGVDRRLADIIDQCLQIDPRKRYPNAQAVLDRLLLRHRKRERSTLISLGIVGPALLLAAMTPLFVDAMRKSVDQLQTEITSRALESDAMAARIQARSLEHELSDRLAELEDAAEAVGSRIADDPDFDETVRQVTSLPRETFAQIMTAKHGLKSPTAGPADDAPRTDDAMPPDDPRPDWIRALDDQRERVLRRHSEQQREPDTSWFLTDRRGDQIWRRDFSPGTIGRNYTWRHYFHGQTVDGQPNDMSHDTQPGSVVPIETANISIAFRSEATGRYMVAMSVPVRSADGSVIGVLARTTHLGHLQHQFDRRIERTGEADRLVDRHIALADARSWTLLDHPWIRPAVGNEDESDGNPPDPPRIAQTIPSTSAIAGEHDAAPDGIDPDRLFQLLELPQHISQRLRKAAAGQSDDAQQSGFRHFEFSDYEDPVGRIPGASRYTGEWLAAMAPVRVKGTRWMVIVQERKDEALAPVAEMTRRAEWYGLIILLTSVGLFILMWLLVTRAMDDSNTDSHLNRQRRRDTDPRSSTV